MTAITLDKRIERKGFGKQLWQFIFRRKTLVLGILFVTAITLIAIFAEKLAPYDPVQTPWNIGTSVGDG
jgi:ABC-type dipeptide/oligopeptide/nickel transport system permease subunit